MQKDTVAERERYLKNGNLEQMCDVFNILKKYSYYSINVSI
jgi:hypothetical protein